MDWYPVKCWNFFSISVKSHLRISHQQGSPHTPAVSPLSSLCLLRNCLQGKKGNGKMMVFKTSRIMRRLWVRLQYKVSLKTPEQTAIFFSGWITGLAGLTSLKINHTQAETQSSLMLPAQGFVLLCWGPTLGTWWRVSWFMLLPWELSQSWSVPSIISLLSDLPFRAGVWYSVLRCHPLLCPSEELLAVQLCSPGERSDTGFLICPGPFHLTQGTQ